MVSYHQVAAAPPPAGGPACTGMLEQLRAGYCTPLDPHAQIRQPSADAAREAEQLDAMVAQSRAGLRQQCPGPDLDARFAEMDRCLEANRAAARVEQEAQAERLPRERRRVPAVQRDARYRAAHEQHRRALEDVRVAREDVDDAKQREGLDCGRRQADCGRLSTLQGRVDRAVAERVRVEAELQTILDAHDIDPRDGVELGLWEPS